MGATKPPADVTQAELETVCRDANILDFILSLPQGFDTEVGGKGSQLSGGQKRKPSMVIFVSTLLILLDRTNCDRPCIVKGP